MARQTTRAMVLKARKLRSNPSLPEALLWRELKQADGLKFRRQHPAGPYVVDFYCPAAKLCIEVDGIAHDMGDRPERDTVRAAWLEAQGYRVMRIPARDVLRDTGQVASAIVVLCRAGR